MLVRRDDIQQAALARIARDQDGLKFIEWLQACLDKTEEILAYAEGDVPARQFQGRAQLLRELLNTLRGLRS